MSVCAGQAALPLLQHPGQGDGAHQVFPRLLLRMSQDALRHQTEEVPQVQLCLRRQRLPPHLHHLSHRATGGSCRLNQSGAWLEKTAELKMYLMRQPWARKTWAEGMSSGWRCKCCTVATELGRCTGFLDMLSCSTVFLCPCSEFVLFNELGPFLKDLLCFILLKSFRGRKNAISAWHFIPTNCFVLLGILQILWS